MSDFARVAIVGTGQVAFSNAEQTGTALDPLVTQLPNLPRERTLLLRAGGLAVLRRAARPIAAIDYAVEPAAPESLRTPSPRLSHILGTLLAETNDELLGEALERMATAGLRLPEELLPRALSKARTTSQRERLRPVLGARGLWLSQRKAEWAWAHALPTLATDLPNDLEAHWDEASAPERKALLVMARKTSPELARKLVAGSWKQEKAEQRLAWLDILATNLSSEDEAFLSAALTDRSGQVRTRAAQLLWRLPDSEVACRMRDRVSALVSFKTPASGMLSKLKTLVGAGANGVFQVDLPPEEFDAAWEKEGVVEAAPQGAGRRQWWLAQMMSAVEPDYWTARFGVSAEKLVAAALEHELANVLLDGLTSASLRHNASDWFAPLWDAWSTSSLTPVVSGNPRDALSARLTAEQAEPRMVALLASGRNEMLDSFPVPWPRSVASKFVGAAQVYRPAFTALLPIAAMAIPADLLPTSLPVPEVPDNDYAAQAYLRALDQFHSIASVRRAIAEEIAP